MTGKTRSRRSQPKHPEQGSQARGRRGPEVRTANTVDPAEALRRTAAAPLSAAGPESILALQQAVGNRAVQRLIAQKRGDGRPSWRPANPGVAPQTTAPPGIQREPDNGKPKGSSAQGSLTPEVMKELKEKINKQVKQGPVPQLPSDSQINETKKEAEAQGKEIAPLVKNNPAMAAFVHANMTKGAPSGGSPPPPPSPAQAQAQAGAVAGTAPKTQQPQQGSAGAAGGKKKKSYVGKKKRRAGHKERAGLAGELGDVGQQATGTGLDIAEGVVKAGGGVLKGAADVAGKVFGWIGVAFGFIMAAFDIRAIASSAAKVKDLKDVLTDVRAKAKPGNAQEQELLGAVEYAIEQKYKKIARRAVSLGATLTSTGVGVAALAAGVAILALASNPVGWLVAAGILGLATLVGLGMLFYKIGRAIFKWAKGRKGKVRGEMAEKLYDNAAHGEMKGLAQRAIKSLGLNWAKMKKSYEGAPKPARPKVRKSAIGLIKGKLASS